MSSTCTPHRFFVSLQGDDSWTGTLPAPNQDKSDGPFRTPFRGQQAARDLRDPDGKLPGEVEIVLRAGSYYLDEALAFTAADSGILWKNFGDEIPILSGGRRIEGWQESRLNGIRVLVAELPEVAAGNWSFLQFFVNGERRFRPRLPKTGFHQLAGLPEMTPETKYSEGQTCFEYQNDDVQNWRNIQDIEVVSLNYWIDSRMWIKEVDFDKKLVTMDRKSDKRMTDDYTGDLGVYYLENIMEALDTPGEWYLDRGEGKLYYAPLPGETADSIVAEAPVLPQILRFEGTEDARIRGLRFEGIQFSHNEWKRPGDKAAFGQSASSIPAALEGCFTTVSFTRCAFEQLGTYAVELGDGCIDCNFSRCELRDLGAGAIKLWHGSSRNTISDCIVKDGGHQFLCGVGIIIGQSSANKVLHNHIHHFYYSGISVGWTWGYGPSSAFGNVFEWNHIHHIGQGQLSDMGGIYCLGISTGTRIRYNLFHDVDSRGYGGWAIYTDEGSTDILIEKNIAYNCKSAVFHQHYGRDNLIRNNILAFGREAQIARTRVEPHSSFTFEANIVYFEEGKLLSGNWSEVAASFDRNLYWDSSARPLDFAGRSLAQWQRLSQDRRAVVADPLFVDPAERDFRLRPGSPAPEAIGFEPFDLSSVGPREG